MNSLVHDNNFSSIKHLPKKAGVDSLSAGAAEERVHANQKAWAGLGRKLCAVALFAFASLVSSAQTASYAPGVIAKFGVDGDVRANQILNGSATASGTHDWFASGTGAGLGLIRTDGAAELRSMLQAGQNIAFSRRMTFAPYTAHDGILMMDAVYSRDYMDNDKTAFKSTTTKNSANPTTWGTDPLGVNVPAKADIIDTYVSMRRNGTSLNPLAPSDLVLTMGLTTSSTEGEHYSDFEFYKSRITYNDTTGLFSNSGPSSAGGHTPWKIKSDGSLGAWGDMCMSFSFLGTTVLDIAVYIWVEKKDYLNINPAKFDFVANSFNESTAAPGYGYARIAPNGGGQIAAWATVSSGTTPGPAWGTVSKELSTLANNYYVDNYGMAQFAEAGLNLTALGIDPVFSTAFNPCDPPFTRFMAKTRSSSQFTSSLQDFIGPYEFLDVPFAPAKTLKPGLLTCTVPQVTLMPETIIPSATYSWTTTNGNIVSGANTPTPVVNKPGDYKLTATAFAGCGTDNYTVKVEENKYKPVAVASVLGVIGSAGSGSSATLKGDTAFSGTFGVVSSIDWQWTGPDAYAASTQNATTTKTGEYQLKVTETSSGCFSTARVMVDATVLPVTFRSFAALVENKAVGLAWSIAEAGNLSQFTVQRSTNGQAYKDLGLVFGDGAATEFKFKDHSLASGAGTYYYRVKAQDKSGALVYSQVRTIRFSNETGSLSIALFPNPAKEKLQITLPAQWQNKTVKVQLYTSTGVIAKTILLASANQTETMQLDGLSKGIYVVKAICGEETAQQRIVKD